MKIQIRKILCPVDFSETSGHALEYAKAFAQAHEAQLLLLHVSPPGVYLAPMDPFKSDLSVKYQEELKARAEEGMLTLVEPLEKEGLNVSGQVRMGPPYDEIVKVAKREEADLIVMGTHGLTGLQHVLIGSVAERVVRMAPCPVLTVKHPEHEFIVE